MNANPTLQTLSKIALASASLALFACGGMEDPLAEDGSDLTVTRAARQYYDCRNLSSDDYIFIDASSPHFDSVTSQGTGYSSGTCKSFMVDFDVNASYPGVYNRGHFELRGGFATNLTASQCANSTLYYRVDRKTRWLNNAWSGWTKLESDYIQGQWIPAGPDQEAYCNLYVDTSRFTRPGRGSTHRYRLQVLPKTYAQAQPARAAWHWVY